MGPKMESQVTSTQIETLLSKSYRTESMEHQSGKFWLQKRYLVAFLSFLAWIFLFVMRSNLSISLVDMTSNRSVMVGNETIIQVAEFHWSPEEKGIILSAFFWGYTMAPLGAFMCQKYGGVITFGIGIAATGLLTTLSPFFMRCNLLVYLAARILEGVTEGIASTAFIESSRMWSTPKDVSRLMGLSFSGYVVGATLGYPICGTIAYYLDWKWVFYITGGVSLLWSLIWFTLIRNSPEEDNMMSLQEKRYFKQFNQQTSTQKLAIPWKQILTSKVAWAYWNERFVGAWSESFLCYSLPLYIKDVHDVNIQDIGFISSIPQFCATVGLISASFIADCLRNRGILSPSTFHRLNYAFGQCCAVVLLITVVLSEHFLTSIICFCLFRLFFVTGVVSNQVLPVDLAGQYSTFILGGGQTASALGQSTSPVIMGISVAHHTSAEWSIYFLILSCLNVWGGIVFFIFGSGELQSWAVPSSNTENAEH